MTCKEPSLCDFCGLPLPVSWWQAEHTPGAGPEYCCFGCRFAAEVTRESGREGEIRWLVARLSLAVFLTLNVMVFTMALWTSDVSGQADALESTLWGLFRYLALLFSLPVLWLLGGPLLERSLSELRALRPTTDLLLLLGVGAAFAYSAVSVFRGSGHVYFEVATVVLVMVTLGRWLEATGRHQATTALDALTRLLPEKVRRAAAEGDCEVPLDAVMTGDELRVIAGERIPCDGVIVRGTAAVDEQITTGESAPRERQSGDAVTGGSLNLDGDLVVRVTAGPREGTLQRLIAAVEQARLRAGRHQQLADTSAGWFLPALLLVAAATLIWHLQVHGFEAAMLAALAVVLIACPCALGVATPLAIWAALGTAARRQVVFTSGIALEQLARIRTICFDKTGTLTLGTARLAEVAADEGHDADEQLRYATALAARSQHLFSQALVTAADEAQLEVPQAAEVSTFAGRGLQGQIDSLNSALRLGSLTWLEAEGCAIGNKLARLAEEWRTAGLSLAGLATAGQVTALFGFREQIRAEATAALTACRALGISVEVLTGDHPERGAWLAAELGLPVRAGLSPEEKVQHLLAARARGPVAMVGDGINDAPALAASDVGIALGCGADVAREAAGVCLLGNDLSLLPWAIQWARRTVRVIRQNLFWAFAYNLIGIWLAATGALSPIWAAAAMVVSSLWVVLNSMRLTSTETPADQPATSPPVQESTLHPTPRMEPVR